MFHAAQSLGDGDAQVIVTVVKVTIGTTSPQLCEDVLENFSRV
jgi:hypothetical protein